jgi:Ran-binding protein 3
LAGEPRETRTPAKKNRTQLDIMEEEEGAVSRSRSNSGSPPHSASPPHEMKIRVRQISQGVEDLSWRNMKATTTEGGGEEASEAVQSFVRVEENGSAAGDSINGEITIALCFRFGYFNIQS